MKQRLLLTFVSLLLATMFPIITWAKTGDRFQADLPEGVTAWFIVTDEDNKYCQFGINANGYDYKTPTTIPTETTGNITIPSEVKGYTVKALGYSALRNLTGITEVVIPNTVTRLKPGALLNTGIMSITVPNSVTQIESSVFSGCTALTSINIPETIESIGDDAFYGCSGLTRIDIPASIEVIGTEAFYGCTGLTGVYITDLAKWCAIEFGNYQYQGSNWQTDDKQSNPLIYAKNLYLNNELVESMVIPDGVETIQPHAFWGAC